MLTDTLIMDKQIRNERNANAQMAAQTGRPALTPEQLEIIRRLGA